MERWKVKYVGPSDAICACVWYFVALSKRSRQWRWYERLWKRETVGPSERREKKVNVTCYLCYRLSRWWQRCQYRSTKAKYLILLYFFFSSNCIYFCLKAKLYFSLTSTFFFVHKSTTCVHFMARRITTLNRQLHLIIDLHTPCLLIKNLKLLSTFT